MDWFLRVLPAEEWKAVSMGASKTPREMTEALEFALTTLDLGRESQQYTKTAPQKSSPHRHPGKKPYGEGGKKKAAPPLEHPGTSLCPPSLTQTPQEG